MSASIIILKEIKKFSYINILNNVKEAAKKSKIHCIHINTYLNNNEFEDLDGTLSEVNEKKLRENYENGIDTKQCTFNIRKPTEFSYDSFTWLVNNENYFWAFDLQNLNGEYEFAFHFLSQYFSIKDNINDYLWFDDSDWYYSAQDIIKLSQKSYNPEWAIKKLPI